ncbi:MAG: hypothetical protein AUG14_04040 [Candidatus Rokubacteria bacterium 13_1_20CM_2_68_19]|nr:MAG: hypothetical protein AUH76_12245 [Candidatus Rokubacteria bacterium 13_1_40CM_4_67_11]OLD96845.1 MAG: hypothetical protein AUG80_13060 [Candidatus Rokubacteria bacterium 13_1_20CM_4_68_9]OLE44614.1 MAG: hypothetical protein AUG14_04040 [Candidatus Rokubacteria bacterium 13_1_20CM_2_68_19]PYN69016.1 MAG: hypothetical protein DMD90_03465 [Candidatus Rokubacteria bacterium]
MTVEGFASFREVIHRAVCQLDGAPQDVLEAVQNHVRVHQELVIGAWDELRHRGGAVTHVTKSEYDRSFQLVSDIVLAKGADIPVIWRDPDPVAKALNELIAQEVKAHHQQPRR